MRKKVIMMALVAIAAVPALGQNLDPTVNVTKTYEGKLLEVDKPSFRMAVPDSVTKFNLDFDYSVFQRPYRGSYEFTPYLQDITPERTGRHTSSFYLKAGVGYTLHPTFEAVWTPIRRERFNMSVYGSHKSYFGKYHQMDLGAADENGLRRLDQSVGSYKGFDTRTVAGIDGRYDWEGGALTFDANYLGYAAKDVVPGKRLFNGMNASVRAKAKDGDDTYFWFDVAARYSYGNHSFKDAPSTMPVSYVTENAMYFDASLGPVLSYYHAVLVDVDMDIISYGASLDSHAGLISLTPKYVYSYGRWNIEAGVKIEFLLKPDDTNVGVLMNQTKGQIVYPKVRINCAAVPDYLNVYLNVLGGANVNSYTSMLARNHWFNPLYAKQDDPLIDNTVERVNAVVGVNGNVAHMFSYDLSGGYVNRKTSPMEGIYRADDGSLMPCARYEGYNKFFTTLKFNVETDPVSVDGEITYMKVKLLKEPKYVVTFASPELMGRLKVTYNWRHRLFAGVTFEGQLGRKGCFIDGGSPVDLRLPGFADLGLFAEYRINRMLSVWATGGNLMAQKIQKTPLYVEKGANFTAGICLNL